jgi:protein-tyrosine phosphatase/membrane-associated phospholipid phosphatase
MKRPWGAAAGVTALTSLLFVVVYNVCNQLTHARPDVGVWAFAWERHWPVVPAMIVPYWSIDLLFVAAPFLCSTREELAIHRRRIVFVILGGALGFLLIPLRFAFPRPAVTGAFAPWFAALYTFDFPHNLFPSLHIALRTLLADLYVRKCRGVWRWVAHVWFSLVGISTLLTWQHHLVDVLGGFWLAAIALQLFQFDAAPPLRASNRTVAWLYAAGAVACTQLARIAWPWTFILVWPAFALGTAAFGYAGHGSIYRKVRGRLTLATKVLFAPLLAGQWFSWWYYRRKSAPWSELTPRVWIGSVLREGEARAAIAAGVTAVLDLTVEFSQPEAFGAVRYLHLPVLDLTAPTRTQLAAAVDFIERESVSGIAFIHCKAGYSRTAAAAAAWLLASGRVPDAAAAFDRLDEVRPGIVIRPEVRAALTATE